VIVEIGDVRMDLTDDQLEHLRRQLAIPDAEIDAEVAARDQRADEEAFIGSAEAARRLGVSAEYVREHAAELGGEKLHDGPKAQWRFDPATLHRPSSPPAVPAGRPVSRRRAQRPTGDLLQVRGDCP
jgi:hypothetical protein